MFANSKRRKESVVSAQNASENVDQAMRQLDLFTRRLESLKNTINDTAKEIAILRTPESTNGNGRHSNGYSSAVRYYLQVPDVGTMEDLRKIRAVLSKCGRVVDSGTGTDAVPADSWLEVAVRDRDLGAFQTQLSKLTFRKVLLIEPGQGRLLARQLDLFPAAAH